MKKATIVSIVSIFLHTTLYSQNPAGFALSLDGAGDYMFVGISPELQILGDVTVEAWVYINSYPTGVSPFAHIVSNSALGELEEENAIFTLAITSDGLVDGFHENGAGINNAVFSKSKVPLGAWGHFAEVRNITAQTYEIYINGVLDTVGTYPNNPTGGTNSAFYVGSNSGGLHFHGILDEVRVWNTVRTQAELQATINGTLGPQYYTTSDSGLVGYWRFDLLENLGIGNDGLTDDVRDLSINGNHGDLVDDATLVPSGAPPQISHSPISSGTSGQSLTISAVIVDNVEVQSAALFYRRGGASSYTSIAMANSGGDVWEGTIPASFVTDRGVGYNFTTQDAGGNMATFPTNNPRSNPQVIQVTSNDLSFSSPNLAYRMISVPIDLDNPSPSSVFEDDLGSYDDTQWRFLRYLNGNNVEFPNAGNLQAGLGFWLITRGAKSLDTGSGISVSTGQNFIVTLQPGWNQIGNPFAFPVNWQDVIRNGVVEDVLVGYQGSTNDATGYDFTRTQLQPFQGYFVNNQEANNITIEIPPQSATGTTALAKQGGLPVLSTLASDEWTLQLTAKSGRYLDKDNYIGALNEASDTWDRYDFSEAPFFDSFVSLYFPHEDWEVYPGLYTGDFRSINSEGHYWDFHVKSNIANSEVVLTLAHIQNLPAETEVVLFDRASRISISLLEQDSYTFPSSEEGAERDFRIVVGKSDFVDSNDLDFSGIPEAFTLLQNYPNPFNPETNIDYELPAESAVKIAIYNLRGQRVRVLLDAQQNPGRYTVSWDGKLDNRLTAASGVYLIRMRAGNFVSVRKVLLTK